ncbi:methylated-DNA--[protein]-cysteine S-methyltransferase [Lysinibacter sp. HNR]|uniref:methylated-DNA--[protein]-cysteine S-methyltransferase n=1 Tax=Lysinibacter sp. HNR TaxID=3031408 RepID=UPI002434E475|nr:methylated-DNA--[protein]-cysteine S-methyltransferase [Lysinibacter sp. HNR]WGD36505.1 methylated-DNA--[protein]-cysteine S-methyltransferase [Lysinibacter sp. HNR]
MQDTTGIVHAIAPTPLGDLTFVADGKALRAIYFPGHWTNPNDEARGEAVDWDSEPIFALALQQIKEYLDTTRKEFSVPTAPVGNEFQLRVWDILRAIPYGSTRTYGDIAHELGSPSLARRVGGAVGSNPLSIIIPCHRVVGSDGSLTGYAGGLERKRLLLQLEEPPLEESGKLF